MGDSRNVEIVNDSPGNRKEERGRERELGRKGKKKGPRFILRYHEITEKRPIRR